MKETLVNFVMFLFAAVALFLAIISYQRSDRLVVMVSALEQAQDADTRHDVRVLTLGAQLQKLLGLGPKKPAPKKGEE